MFTCAQCTGSACQTHQLEQLPKNCPMRDEAYFGAILAEYQKPENYSFFLNCTAVEAIGYCQWPRLRETAEFAKRMGYTKLGMAFCAGLHKEAGIVDQLLRKQGFEITSVICKTGSIPKCQAGIPPELTLRSADEPMCNPIAQAQLLNRAQTQLNICLGLCVGHDSLFYKYCDAPVTTLVVKDRVTGHNPVAAIQYANTYFASRLGGAQP